MKCPLADEVSAEVACVISRQSLLDPVCGLPFLLFLGHETGHVPDGGSSLSVPGQNQYEQSLLVHHEHEV